MKSKKSDPTPKCKRILISILTRLRNENKIDEKQYRLLYPTTANTPRSYCTTKIHKKYKENEMFNSHDVVSLFTNTPIKESLEIIKKRLMDDKDLKKRTKLDANDIIELLEFILTTTYFEFRGAIYRQRFGAAMGSPVSPIVANFFMEFLEQQAIATTPLHCRPRLWKRYVDDVLEIINKGQVQLLTDHLNQIDTTNSIKFTHEEEKDSQIPFLDTLIIRKPDGTMKLLVYRKPTHTDQYLNFMSEHPLHQKMGVIHRVTTRTFIQLRKNGRRQVKNFECS